MGEGEERGERAAKPAPRYDVAPFRIFLNYRREDSAGHVGRLWDVLRSGVEGEPGFADDQIFIDIDTIEPGVDFREAIRKAVEASDVFLAVIGKQWVAAVDSKGRRRLDDPADFVRIEIEAALERAAEHRDVRVVPTRVQGADMPGISDLPGPLAELAHRNAVELTDERWHYDAGRLLAWLKKLEREKLERASPQRPPELADEPPQTEPRARAAKPRPSEAQPRRPDTGRRESIRKGAFVAAILVAAGVVAALVVGLTSDGEGRNGNPQPPSPQSGALVWQRAGGADLGGEGDQVMTSVDEVAVGEAAYVAGGYDTSSGTRDAAVWASREGRTWRRLPGGEGLEAPGDQTINTVTDVGGGLLAAGADTSEGDSDAALWGSSDGRQWEAAPGLRLEGTDEVIYRVNTNTGVGLVAAGWQTRDGEDDAAVWIFPSEASILEKGVEPVTFGGPGQQKVRRVVARRGGPLVAVGLAEGDAGVWTSEDGQEWDRVEVAALGGEGEQEILDATRFGTSVVAVGRDGERGAVWLSRDGRRWTRAPDREGLLASPEPVRLNRVFATGLASSGAPALVAGGMAGGDAAVWTSNDAREWAREPGRELEGDGEQAINSLRSGPDLGVIAVGSSGSENGLDAAVWLGAASG